jgi:hypothetical protein
MNEARPAFSYRDDPAVPPFDDSRPLFVFDGFCVLCSGGASWLMKHDREGRIALTSAQGEIGSALYRHYRIAMDETYLLLRDGRVFTKRRGLPPAVRRDGRVVPGAQGVASAAAAAAGLGLRYRGA